MKTKLSYSVIAIALLNTAQGDLSSILEPIQKINSLTVASATIKPETEAPLTYKKIDNASIPEKSNIEERKAIILNWQTVVDALKTQLISKYKLEGVLRINSNQFWKEVKVFSPDWNIEITNYPVDGLVANITLAFRIIVDGNEIGTWKVPSTCELWQDVYVSKNYIRKGIQLEKNMFEIHAIDILRVREKIVSKDTELDAYESANVITAGKPLFCSNIVASPDIHKGKMVEVVAQEGLLKVSMKGQALREGMIGDFIPIKNLVSGKDIQGQIINSQTVQVYF